MRLTRSRPSAPQQDKSEESCTAAGQVFAGAIAEVQKSNVFLEGMECKRRLLTGASH
jgi:hypothetical protein